MTNQKKRSNKHRNWYYYVSGQTPGHAQISSQTGEAPAVLSVNKATVTPGQVIELSLTSRDNSTFKGFIIQARDAKIKDQQVKTFFLIKIVFDWQINSFKKR